MSLVRSRFDDAESERSHVRQTSRQGREEDPILQHVSAHHAPSHVDIPLNMISPVTSQDTIPPPHSDTVTPHLQSQQHGSARIPFHEPIRPFTCGQMSVTCKHCHALHWVDERVSNSTRRNPEFGRCCNHGLIELELDDPPPDNLRQLFVGQDSLSKRFKENIRQYNAALAFTSLGVDIVDSINTQGRGPYVFKIAGELSHLSGSLLPEQGEQPCYAQLYVYDPEDAVDNRMRRNHNLSEDIMQILTTTLTEHHHYAHIYRHAHQILTTQHSHPDVDVTLRLCADQARRRRQYDLPTTDEIAAVIPGDGMATSDSRDIILTLHSGTLRRISDAHPAYATLHYVLLFPFGTLGWSWDLYQKPASAGQSPQTRISQCQFYAYQLHPRHSMFPTIFYGGRLFQQYIVDVWASTDQHRLSFLLFNQPKLRAALYSGLEDTLAHADDVIDPNELGKRIVLPSSYTGGPRYMHQLFQDAMALARYFHNIDLFITVTCNPSWPEITRELLPGQSSADRPDLVARVFALYKDAIINDLFKQAVFGAAAGYVYTIEFQKRGLPHMHLLLFLQPCSKITQPSNVDSVVRAFWPDPDVEPVLFDIVKKCMIHGPCGAANPSAPCMDHGKCTKRFPKPFQRETAMNRDGYPLYRRPDDGRSFDVRGLPVNNQWIVPYNPFLSSKYKCHINVECLVSFASTKYITKYTHKGPDRATLEIVRDNEIQRYLSSRYISGSEAAWRLFQFNIHRQIPNVVRLQIHLPGQHSVVFNPSDTLERIMQRAATEKTMLTEFFETNKALERSHSSIERYTYQQFPQHYTWKSPGKNWQPRQRHPALGRMYFVSPTAGERFYLRTLLTVIKGPTSFENLRSFDGVQFDSFRETCIARGLLEDDGEWRQCLREASAMQTGTQFRLLFATILLYCAPAQPHSLWLEFQTELCDDLFYRLSHSRTPSPSTEQVTDFGLYLIDGLLRESGHCLRDFPSMPTPQHNWEVEVGNPLISEQLAFNRDEQRVLAEEHIALLNEKQRLAYDDVVQSVLERRGQLFFLHGPGGTGKTFVYKTISYDIRRRGLIVLCVASSGIAALLLPGGRTSHSTFKIPVEGLCEQSTCSVEKRTNRAALFRDVSLIIWDEVVMQHRFGPEAVDRMLRDIRDDDRPFGGITVVFGGDYQQILPVVVHGDRESIVDASLQYSPLWQQISLIQLHENVRVRLHPNAQQFASWLLDIGHGRSETGSPSESVQIPPQMLCVNERELINAVYGGVESSPPPPPQFFLSRTILAPRNADVETLNNAVLDRMQSTEHTFLSADSCEQELGVDGDNIQPVNVSVEFLRSQNCSSLPLAELRVKIGCPLILLRNLAPSHGLCNGSRMILVQKSDRVLQVVLIGGDHDGETALIPRISLTPSTDTTSFAFKLRRRQYPVRVAFAMSIHRSQGQTVDHVGLDLRTSIFSHGQLYVAFSRTTGPENLKILLPPGDLDDATPNTTTNVVYPEVLLD